MLRMKILRIDGSILVNDVEVQGHNAKRGTGDGIIWRGKFSVPSVQLRPTFGETVILVPSDDRAVSAVVTLVAGSEIHFRAPGRVPQTAASELAPTTGSRSEAPVRR
jgi:hypothetical protein